MAVGEPSRHPPPSSFPPPTPIGLLLDQTPFISGEPAPAETTTATFCYKMPPPPLQMLLED